MLPVSMLPNAARDRAKSITNWAWALSLFATQQAWNLVVDRNPGETADALSQVKQSMTCGCSKGAQQSERRGEPMPAADMPKRSRLHVEHFPGESAGQSDRQMSSVQ